AVSSHDDETGAFSADGRQVVFVSDRTGEEQLWLMTGDGSQVRQASFFKAADEVSGGWIPGRPEPFVAVRSKDLGERSYLLNLETAQLEEIRNAGFACSASRDGKSIYVRSSRSGRPEIWRVPLSGGQPKQ